MARNDQDRNKNQGGRKNEPGPGNMSEEEKQRARQKGGQPRSGDRPQGR